MSLKMILPTIPLILLLILVALILIPACAPNPNTVERVGEYNTALENTAGASISATSPNAKDGIKAFSSFLTKISDMEYVRKNTSNVYSPDAYLNDTLVTHNGAGEIEKYFLRTAETMDTYEVTIDDTASSGINHYIRWTMTFSAPKLNGGKPVKSAGMSHIRLNEAGQVTMHQDYWDSGTNIYGQIPVLGGAIESIRRRFEK